MGLQKNLSIYKKIVYVNKVKKNIFHELEKKNYEIQFIQKINNGNNSEVFFIKTNNEDLILKVYPNKSKDKRDRLGAELDFINLLEKGNYFHKPKLITYDKQLNYSIFTKLPGQSLTKYSFENWMRLCDFAIEVNDIGIKYKREWNRNASEAYFVIDDHFQNVKKRLIKISNYYKDIGLKSIDHFISRILIPRFQKIYLQEHNKNNLSKKLNSITLSVSDIGFHNCNLFNNKLLFYDFEYAGWDFTGKLATDIIINPRHKLDLKVALKIISKLDKELNVETWISEMQWTIPLYAIKWCIISLQNKGGFSKKEELNVETWISKTNDYLLHCNQILQAMNLS